ncbi:MAG: YybH family protein [bacterium]
MRKLALVLLCLVLACANRNPTQDAKDMMKSHEEYAKAGDLDGVMTNVADDIVALVPGIPLVEGKAAFKEFYAGLLAMASIDDFGHDYHGIEIIGDTVVLHGVANGTQTAKDGAAGEFANNFLLVLKYQPDGKIKFWRIAFAPSSEEGSSS